MTLTITIEGFKTVDAAMAAVSNRIDRLNTLQTQVGLIAQADVDRRFETSPGTRSTGIVYGGVVWPRLTEPYLKANPRREGGQQLRDTGELLQSFGVGNRGNVLRADGKNAIVFGTALPKARGLNRKRKLLVVHKGLVIPIRNLFAKFVRDGKA